MRRWIFLAGIMAVPLLAHAQEGPPPRDPGRAASDLIRVYSGHDDTEIGRRAAQAGKGDKACAAYLLAMARQTLSDEPHGRWANGTFYPGYRPAGSGSAWRRWSARSLAAMPASTWCCGSSITTLHLPM